MDKVRTVSDTKRDFYTYHTRPINSIYRRFVEELLVEMHLLSVNADFKDDPIYALGVVTSFERFMQGYRPEEDKRSIFRALCQSVGGNPEQYRQAAENLLALGKGLSLPDLLAKMSSATPGREADRLLETLQEIAQRKSFKYSRLFGIGLYTILTEADPDLVKDEQKRQDCLQQISEVLHLPPEKLLKDLDLYRSNVDKVEQLLAVLDEALQAERKRQEQRKQERDGQGESREEGGG